MYEKPSRNTLKCTKKGAAGSSRDLFVGKTEKTGKTEKNHRRHYAPAACLSLFVFRFSFLIDVDRRSAGKGDAVGPVEGPRLFFCKKRRVKVAGKRNKRQ